MQAITITTSVFPFHTSPQMLFKSSISLKCYLMTRNDDNYEPEKGFQTALTCKLTSKICSDKAPKTHEVAKPKEEKSESGI